MSNINHSTGRGGAGNIGKDDTAYVDGDIVREGVVGEPGRADGGDYSAGRGGAGNIGHGTPKRGTTPQPPTDKPTGAVATDIVPETAMKQPGEQYENFHTGRGGQGNVHKDKYGGHSKPQKGQEGYHEGIVEKVKHAVGLDKKKEGETK